MELLRIVAMFLVLVVHADFFSLGQPTALDKRTAPFASFMRYFTESVSIVCVNVFVLLSGWFGIKPSIRGAGNFLFQCVFYRFALFVLFFGLGLVPFSFREIAQCLYLVSKNWFVLAYLCLYILSPVLNAFVEKATRRQFAAVLSFFFLFQTLYAWIGNTATDFQAGFSTISLVGLYLLARYLRVHPPALMRRIRGGGIFLLYCALTLASACCAYKFNPGNRLYFYSAPHVIAGAALLLLYFSKLRFRSSTVNRLAASTFAVYLIHLDPHVSGYFKSAVVYLYGHYGTVPFVLLMGLFLCSVFFGCILIDQLRLFLWRWVWRWYERFRPSVGMEM